MAAIIYWPKTYARKRIAMEKLQNFVNCRDFAEIQAVTNFENETSIGYLFDERSFSLVIPRPYWGASLARLSSKADAYIYLFIPILDEANSDDFHILAFFTHDST